MAGLVYQLKSIWRDKFCMLSFLLPIAAAAAVQFAGVMDFSAQGRIQSGMEGTKQVQAAGLLPAVIVLIAMFMGCTFNAVNMIAEKENGVDLINRILPMTRRQYISQKIFVGFVCGSLSAVITACICFRMDWKRMLLLLVLILLSAAASALIGLLIGRVSDNIMTGVVLIKTVMLVFLAVPLVKYLMGLNKVFSVFSQLVPSTAAFEGMLGLVSKAAPAPAGQVCILTAHCIGWFLVCLAAGNQKNI